MAWRSPGPGIEPVPQQQPEPWQWQCQILNLLNRQGTVVFPLYRSLSPFFPAKRSNQLSQLGPKWSERWSLFKEGEIGVSWWLSVLRIWHCHRCGLGLIPGLFWAWPKTNKQTNEKPKKPLRVMEIFQTNSSFSPCHMTAKDQLTKTRKEEKILLNWNLISFKKKSATTFAGFGSLKGCLSFIPPTWLKQKTIIKPPNANQSTCKVFYDLWVHFLHLWISVKTRPHTHTHTHRHTHTPQCPFRNLSVNTCKIMNPLILPVGAASC